MKLAALCRLTTVATALVTASAARANDPSELALTLGEALDIATKHPLVRSAQARAQATDAEVDVARAGYYPSATTTVVGGLGAVDQLVVPDPPTRIQSSIALAQATANAQLMLYDFGRVSGAVNAARAANAEATANRSLAEYRQLLDVAVQYFIILGDEEAAHDAESALVQRTDLHAIVHELVSAGARPRIDESRAALEIETAKLEVAGEELRLREDTAALAAALGFDPLTNIKVAPVDGTLLPPDEDAERAARDALAARPEIAVARARGAQAIAQRDVARGMGLPSISAIASGQLSYTSVLGGVGLPGNAEGGQVGFSVVWPFLDLSVGPRRRAAEMNILAVDEQLRAQSLTVRSDAVRATIAVEGARALLEQAERVLREASLNVVQARERYAQGIAPVVDEVIDAVGRERAATAARARSRFALQIARIKLLAAVSGPSFADRLRASTARRK